MYLNSFKPSTLAYELSRSKSVKNETANFSMTGVPVHYIDARHMDTYPRIVDKLAPGYWILTDTDTALLCMAALEPTKEAWDRWVDIGSIDEDYHTYGEWLVGYFADTSNNSSPETRFLIHKPIQDNVLHISIFAATENGFRLSKTERLQTLMELFVSVLTLKTDSPLSL